MKKKRHCVVAKMAVNETGVECKEQGYVECVVMSAITCTCYMALSIRVIEVSMVVIHNLWYHRGP